MKSKIFLCLLLIMTMLTFGACGDDTPEAVTPDNENNVVDENNGDNLTEDMNEAVDNAQEENNNLDGKDTTQRDNVNDVPATDKQQ